jgi:DNA-directed RNA polymerase subunit M/transcription elongation factor TFIIS
MATRKPTVTPKRRAEVVKVLNEYINNTPKCQVLEEAMYAYSLDTINEMKTNLSVDYVKDDVHDPIFMSIYEDKLNELVSNMDPMAEIPNPFLLDRLNNMTLDEIGEVVRWKQTQMFPEYWQRELEKMDKELMMRNTVKTTDLHTCRKCGQNKITFYMKQTRAADEPITTFYKCQVCGHGWKTN